MRNPIARLKRFLVELPLMRFGFLFLLLAGTCVAATSPDGRAACAFRFENGRAVFAVTYDRRPVATVSTGRGWRKVGSRGPCTARLGSWKTVWGERSVVRDAYSEELFDVIDAKGRTVVVFSNAPEVFFILNGSFYGAKVPDRVKTCVWRDVPLAPGENRLEFRAGPQTRRQTIRRRTSHCDL